MHPFTPILAKIPFEVLIYLFFGVLWIIGVISERMKKRNRAARPPPPRNRAPPEPPADEPESAPDPMTEFQRQLKELLRGETPEYDAPAQAEPDPPPAWRTPAPEPAIRFDPSPGPVSRYEAGVPPAPGMVSQEDAFAQLADMADIEEVMREGGGASVVAGNANAFMVNLSKLKMPLIRTPVMSQAHTRTRTAHRDLRNRRILRESVVNNVILGPPKGL